MISVWCHNGGLCVHTSLDLAVAFNRNMQTSVLQSLKTIITPPFIKNMLYYAHMMILQFSLYWPTMYMYVYPSCSAPILYTHTKILLCYVS